MLTRRALVAASLAVPFIGTRPLSGRSQEPDRAWPIPEWEIVSPQTAGIDPCALDAVEARVAGETPDLSALLVVRDGRLVWERYFNGQPPG
ncbi:MAG TPA: hypothetical protein VER37_01565, partial [Thermomicrobiales bacterium]|nr:hypothetical protein [Thermomicrobiales bacterium]